MGIVLGETATTGTTGDRVETLGEGTMETGIVSEETATTEMVDKEGLVEETMEMGIVLEGTVTTGTMGVRVETLGMTETVLDETAIMETEDRVEIADNIY